MSTHVMQAAFDRVRSEVSASRIYDLRGKIDQLEEAATAAVYAENERGAEARRVVADVARALGVDIDEGPGHRWDVSHMHRVVLAAESLQEERNDLREAFDKHAEDLRQAREQRDAWKEAMEQMQAKHVLPLQRELREEREKNAALIAERRAAQAAAPRLMWTSTAEEHTLTDEELQRLAESMAMRAPLDSLVSDLKNVIISQAREIARLKGESE
ncbi:hypothetical protein AB0D97_14100 [Streptomyces roseus]|uniref:hypothetical protein n=1 Tax=Streptomyces roseus TaxID=66430 RepID=UPI0033C8DC03